MVQKDKKPKSEYGELVKTRTPVELKEGADFVLADDQEYEGFMFSGFENNNKKVLDIKLQECVIKQSNLSQSHLSSTKFVDIKFDNCDLSNLKIERGYLERVEFIKCRMTGFKAIESRFRDVLFKDCQLKLSQLRMCKFKHIVFDHCIITEGDFYGSDLSGTIFLDSDLTKAEMSGTKLPQVDFRSSKIEGINVSIESLKGAIIDPTQIIYLAGLLGVKIEWKQ